jgi:hypothetical protein
LGIFAFGPGRSRVNGELSAQDTQFLKPCGGVTHNCGDADHLAGTAAEGHDSELDRACAILPNSRDRQDLAFSNTAFPIHEGCLGDKRACRCFIIPRMGGRLSHVRQSEIGWPPAFRAAAAFTGRKCGSREIDMVVTSAKR